MARSAGSSFVNAAAITAGIVGALIIMGLISRAIVPTTTQQVQYLPPPRIT